MFPLQISKNKRHQDRAAALEVWDRLEEFVRSRSHSWCEFHGAPFSFSLFACHLLGKVLVWCPDTCTESHSSCKITLLGILNENYWISLWLHKLNFYLFLDLFGSAYRCNSFSTGIGKYANVHFPSEIKHILLLNK